MASFSNPQHHHYQYPSLLDSAAHLPFSFPFPFPDTKLGEVISSASSSSSCLHNCYPSPPYATNYESSTTSQLSQLSHSSLLLACPCFSGGLVVPQINSCMEEKNTTTKKKDSCLIPLQTKDTKERKKRNIQKREQRKLKASSEKKGAKSCVNPPTEYIHVRARRGQATDSHSLAERVRREKIRERMKMLQGLVPGCDKVTGKALMLDEIINYVQSLQNQVEFLSMKLASVNPLSYDCALDFDGHVNHLQGMSQPMIPSVLQTNHIQSTPFGDATNSSLGVMETSLPVLLHGHGPSTAFSQDNGSALMQVSGPIQGLLHQVVFNNMCNF